MGVFSSLQSDRGTLRVSEHLQPVSNMQRRNFRCWCNKSRQERWSRLLQQDRADLSCCQTWISENFRPQKCSIHVLKFSVLFTLSFQHSSWLENIKNSASDRLFNWFARVAHFNQEAKLDRTHLPPLSDFFFFFLEEFLQRSLVSSPQLHYRLVWNVTG